MEQQSWKNWGIFIILCIIWGSSFILMKEGMKALDAYQVASIRMLSAGVILLPGILQAWKQIPKNKLGWIILSGLLGNFFPAFLFCIAETRISSSLAGVLNAFTPLCTLLIGLILFGTKIRGQQLTGVLIGLVGILLLFGADVQLNRATLPYALMVLLATLFYASNVNMVNRKLSDVGSRNIATIAFTFLIPPVLFILWYTGYFDITPMDTRFWYSTGMASILGIFGTAIASILFYVLLKNAGTVFSSMVTYGMPFVALFWGWVADESIGWWQVISLLLILAGVYLANWKRKVANLPSAKSKAAA